MAIVNRLLNRIAIFKGRPAGITKERHEALVNLCRVLGVNFGDLNLLNQALMHRSYVHDVDMQRGESNERMEFLGDAVLGLLVNEHLYARFTERQEGRLTKIKSLIVSETCFAFFPELALRISRMTTGSAFFWLNAMMSLTLSGSASWNGARRGVSLWNFSQSFALNTIPRVTPTIIAREIAMRLFPIRPSSCSSRPLIKTTMEPPAKAKRSPIRVLTTGETLSPAMNPMSRPRQHPPITNHLRPAI